MAKVELADLRIVAGTQAIGGIDRQPAPGLDVDFAPVVHVPTDALGFPTGLSAGGNASAATERHEEHRLHATIPAPAGHGFLRQARDRAIFGLSVVGDVLGNP